MSVRNVMSAPAQIGVLQSGLHRSPSAVEESELWIKRGIYLYFLLVVFEGALRKWIMPGLATPLLVVRDPIAMWLVYKAWKDDLLPANIYLFLAIISTVLSFCASLVYGHGNVFVAIYGARIMLIHFPLLFIIGSIFSREDVIKMGTLILWLSIPITIIISMQFFSPQTAWVNVGVGGEGGSGFSSGALGYFRPSGVWSFIVGVVHYYALVACFVIYFWFNLKEINKPLLIVSTVCLLATIPFSISRSLLFGTIVTILFVVMAAMRNPKHVGKIIILTIAFGGVIAVLSNYEFFQKSTEVFTARFEHASDVEGGTEGVLMDRFLGGLIHELNSHSNVSFFGYGLGMGTNVGSMLLSGEVAYLISEGEWGRVIGEQGPLFGLMTVFVRLFLCLHIAIACYKKLVANDLLPWILLSACLVIVPQGQFSRPTSLGFAIIIGGLTIAALNGYREKKEINTEELASKQIDK